MNAENSNFITNDPKNYIKFNNALKCYFIIKKRLFKALLTMLKTAFFYQETRPLPLHMPFQVFQTSFNSERKILKVSFQVFQTPFIR
jgi:hypothetical protein